MVAIMMNGHRTTEVEDHNLHQLCMRVNAMVALVMMNGHQTTEVGRGERASASGNRCYVNLVTRPSHKPHTSPLTTGSFTEARTYSLVPIATRNLHGNPI